ncbi:MAG: class I SAM-dependent methyltransferase [Desulfobacterales bacterium]|nr:class I SAM-dependent methyltransferase [Desulfobacterales bacterium]
MNRLKTGRFQVVSKLYKNGEYIKKNPTWHAEDSPWKTREIINIMETNKIYPSSVCEIGCGAGEILNQLYHRLSENVVFHGYEISPQAFEFCQKRKKQRLNFYLEDLLEDERAFFDLILAIDVFEHIEDYFGFLKKLCGKGKYKIFHIPLDISVQTVLRGTVLLKRRRNIGHIHYFTKETALATLEDTGYEILDYYYTAASIKAPNRGLKVSLLKFPRKCLFSLSKDITVRMLGGFSLLVLTK